jgi:hypothetical protein
MEFFNRVFHKRAAKRAPDLPTASLPKAEIHLPPFPTGGVYLRALQKLNEYSASLQPDLITTEVSEMIIKPWTSAALCSMFELMKSTHKDRPHPHLGLTAEQAIGDSPSIFISHSWKYKFSDLIESIELFFAENSEFDKEKTLIWIDVFCNDQWNAPNLPFEWWTTTFRSAIKSIGHTCLVLSPWEFPIPLTRAWCLW